MEKDLNLPDLDHEQGAAALAVRDDVITSRTPKTAADLEQVLDVPVNVTAVLGKTRMDVAQLLKIGPGQLLELDRRVGEAIDIYVNNRLVARGEVVVIEDKLGVTMTEIIKMDR
ncbi:MAG: flagellar motor switch protein FliN [Beijerinckiaceae bacterium]